MTVQDIREHIRHVLDSALQGRMSWRAFRLEDKERVQIILLSSIEIGI